ncbi:hypothetical protein G7046_g8284 [Stylonectria norvegica]|nr:hypothetical protein G7046_g8284 [Stylonectria norvegica]
MLTVVGSLPPQAQSPSDLGAPLGVASRYGLGAGWLTAATTRRGNAATAVTRGVGLWAPLGLGSCSLGHSGEDCLGPGPGLLLRGLAWLEELIEVVATNSVFSHSSYGNEAQSQCTIRSVPSHLEPRHSSSSRLCRLASPWAPLIGNSAPSSPQRFHGVRHLSDYHQAQILLIRGAGQGGMHHLTSLAAPANPIVRFRLAYAPCLSVDAQSVLNQSPLLSRHVRAHLSPRACHLDGDSSSQQKQQ